MLQQIIASLLSAGGLGLINYYVMDRMDKLDLKSDKLILPFLILCSTFNYIIYLFINSILLTRFHLPQDINTAIALLLTIAVSFFASVILSGPLSSAALAVINFVRKSNNNVPIVDSAIWQKICTDTSKAYLCYIYDFDGHLIDAGYLKNKDRENIILALIPSKDAEKMGKDSIEELVKGEIKNGEAMKYIDADKKLIIYFIARTPN